MKIDDALSGVTLLGIDLPAYIYFVEAHLRYGPLVAAIVRAIAAGRLHGITSAVTPAEVLVHPLRTGDQTLLRAYRTLLFDAPTLRTAPIEPGVGAQAAGLRARYRLRTPDALQLAIAVAYGAQAFLTNDHRLMQVQDLRIPLLDELQL
jgi:predicted nucleic acid-binding protein